MDQLELLRRTASVLESQSIAYSLVGSFASRIYGEPRMTQDIDIVLALLPDQVAPLCARFPAPEYYVSLPAARDAVARCGQFNVIHPTSGNKIDFMIVPRTGWGGEQVKRCVPKQLFSDQVVQVARADDAPSMTLPSRREFLQGTAAGLAATACWPALADEDVAKKPTIVDCHTHFYNPSRPEGVPWPAKDNKLLYRTVLPADFLKVASPHGVTKTVVVEASAWLEDNQWILDLAEHEPSIVGFVGHLTPGEDHFAKHVARFAKNRLYRGIRVNGSQLAAGLDDAGYRDDLRRLAEHDLELDVNGGPTLLAAVDRLARELPALRIVINHVANVKIDGREPPDEWQRGIDAAARHPQVYCKVSALVENSGAKSGDAPTDVNFYRPLLDALWNAFGEDRLIYGSNWPVSDRGAPYSTVYAIVRDYFASRGPTAAAKYFSGNALAAYKWVAR